MLCYNFRFSGNIVISLEIDALRLATRVLNVAPMTFVMTQQRTRTICSPKLIALFARLETI